MLWYIIWNDFLTVEVLQNVRLSYWIWQMAIFDVLSFSLFGWNYWYRLIYWNILGHVNAVVMKYVGLDSSFIALGIWILPFKDRELLLLWRGWEKAGITTFCQYYVHHSSAVPIGKSHGVDLVSMDWFKPRHILVVS